MGPDLVVNLNGGKCCTSKQLENGVIALGGLVVSGAAAIAASGAPGPVKGIAATVAKIGGIVMSAITAARAGNDALNGDGNGGREPHESQR